jgi:hypothetical protein
MENDGQEWAVSKHYEGISLERGGMKKTTARTKRDLPER